MDMAVAGDITRAAGAGTDRAQRLLDRREHRRVLAHAEIVVRTPNGDLGADAVVEGTRKAAAAPLEVGKGAVPPLCAQPVETLFEEAFVIHRCHNPLGSLAYNIYFRRQGPDRET